MLEQLFAVFTLQKIHLRFFNTFWAFLISAFKDFSMACRHPVIRIIIRCLWASPATCSLHVDAYLLAHMQRWTYKLWVGEYLAGSERILLRRLVWVFMGDLAEAGHAAGQLTLLQGLQVAPVQTVHGASAYAPVEVVHSLSLQTENGLELPGSKKYRTISNLTQTHAHTHTVHTHSHSHAGEAQGGGGGVFPPS